MKHLFFDMDGTLLTFESKKTNWKQNWLKAGFYLNLKPYKGIDAINELAKNPNYNVYILTNSPNEMADKEKTEWVKTHLPNVKHENIICNRAGTHAKSKAVVAREILQRELTETEILFDDYTKNLQEWQESGGTGIKRKNGINCKKGTWQGLKLVRLTNINKLLQEVA